MDDGHVLRQEKTNVLQIASKSNFILFRRWWGSFECLQHKVLSQTNL